MGLTTDKSGRRKPPQSKVAAAMKEVHKNIPSTVPGWVRRDPAKREQMLRAIAESKARKGK